MNTIHEKIVSWTWKIPPTHYLVQLTRQIRIMLKTSGILYHNRINFFLYGEKYMHKCLHILWETFVILIYKWINYNILVETFDVVCMYKIIVSYKICSIICVFYILGSDQQASASWNSWDSVEPDYFTSQQQVLQTHPTRGGPISYSAGGGGPVKHKHEDFRLVLFLFIYN